MATSVHLCAKEEFDKMTPLHNEMSIPGGKEKIVSIRYRPVVKTVWYSTNKVKCVRTEVDNTVTFKLPKNTENISFICGCYLKQDWPAVSVRPDFTSSIRIAMTPFMGFHHVIHATLMLPQVAQTLQPKVYEFYYNYDKLNRPYADIRCGNLAEMTTWTSELRAVQTTVNQPWFYTINDYQALRLDFDGVNVVDVFQHDYQIHRNLSQLLRMQKLVNGAWVDIPYDSKYIITESVLPLPELWLEVSSHSEDEMDFYKCNNLNKMYYHDFIVQKSINPIKKLSNHIFTSEDFSTLPCSALVWLAENEAAKRFNFSSNYTNNFQEREHGTNPCVRTTFRYKSDSGAVKWDNLEACHFDQAEPDNRFKKAFGPSQPGWNVRCFTTDPFEVWDLGPNLKGVEANFVIQIGNGHDDTSDNSLYNVYLIMMVTRKLSTLNGSIVIDNF